MGSKRDQRGSDARIGRIATRQHGVVSLDQLERAGVRRRGLTRRIRAGRLDRLHRGVYAVGHRGLSREGRWMAAVLACGPDAVLSHTSAAALWGMLPVAASRSPSAPVSGGLVDVTVATRAGVRQRRGIRVHRSGSMLRNQVTRRAGIPVTTPSRTLADLRRILPQAKFAAALRQAEFLGFRIDQPLEPDGTRSELETRFLAVCRRHRLPLPEVNANVEPFTVDFLWRDRRLIVEVDGFQAHGTRTAFEADRERDARLTALGFNVIRVTWRQLIRRPEDVVATLRLARRRGA